MEEFKPHDYQNYMINFVIQQPYCALFCEMGMGKSVTTLTAINELKFNYFAVSKVLIIAPKKVAMATWQNEIAKWDHVGKLKHSTIMGSERERLTALYTRADIYIINRDNVKWLVDHLQHDWFFDMVVIDESSSFKSHKAKRFLALKHIRPRVARVVELTGTPRPKSLTDIWSQIYLLDMGQRLGKNITAFRNQWFRKEPYGFDYEPIPGAEDEIHQRISDLCISLKASDYLKMPEPMENDIPVKLSTKAQKAYDTMEKKTVLEYKDSVIDAATAAVVRFKLLQIASGSCYNDEKQVVHIHDDKLEAFMEAIEAIQGENVIVYYWFKHERDRLIKALKDAKVNVRELSNAQDEKDWNDGKIEVLLSHPASNAYGLNLQKGGHHMIWFTLPDSLELYQQSIARLWRQGQESDCVLIHRLLVEGSIDYAVKEGLARKEKGQQELIDSVKAVIEKWRGD